MTMGEWPVAMFVFGWTNAVLNVVMVIYMWRLDVFIRRRATEADAQLDLTKGYARQAVESVGLVAKAQAVVAADTHATVERESADLKETVIAKTDEVKQTLEKALEHTPLSSRAVHTDSSGTPLPKKETP